MKRLKSLTAIFLSLMLGIGMVPAYAFADPSGTDNQNTTTSSEAIVIDKKDFYKEAEEDMVLLNEYQTNAFAPRALSDEFKYYAKYESGQNYNQGFSKWDGYNAVGYYQFDRRYSLQNFMESCYYYNPSKYAMFQWLTTGVDISVETIYDYNIGALTAVGQGLEDSWHAAYNADPSEFAALQDGFSYENYYLPARNHLASLGINIDNRSDCVKGLAWGLCNLFGSGGWRQFVGGQFNGTWHAGAGLRNDMSDWEFVTTLCNYVVNNVGGFYPGQPQYHEGWQNRYRNELQDCYYYLGYFPDVDASAWYFTSGALTYVVKNGIMYGYENRLFGPYDYITRGQVVTILWRCSGSPQVGISSFPDVATDQYYSSAVAWAAQNKVVSGFDDGLFRPDAHVSRQDLAVMIHNYACWRKPVLTLFNAAKITSLKDASKIDSYAYDGMAWCVDKGIMNGIDDGKGGATASPRDKAWRASMASMMTMLYKII